MSKPVKELLKKELTKRFEGLTSLAIVDVTGIDAVTNCWIRGRLHEKNILLSVVKNSLARQAFRDVGLDLAVGLLEGPCAVVYGSDNIVSVVRELLDIRKEAENLTVKAAVLEGEVFGADRIDELSKYPTREEAIGQVLSCALSAGANIAGCLIGPGSQVAGLVEAVEQKQDDRASQAPQAA